MTGIMMSAKDQVDLLPSQNLQGLPGHSPA